ncbi:MAG: ADP-ribosylglycohydrolase family protein [Chloroflexi bacterium]|nr:ADP-ribosylglycohydrolase family protein [Chloroflexota bacterium]
MMTSSPTQPERIRGALLGLAWGDVLGCPVEGWDARHIRAVYGAYKDLPAAAPAQPGREGRSRPSRARPLGLHSDDTQQALALLNVCLAPGGWTAEQWAECLVQGLAAGAWRGYGRNFSAAVARLAHGAAPQRAGNRTAGIGAAMRAGPLGALYHDDPARLATVVMESSLTTHGDIRAAAVAYAVAYAVAGFVAERSAAEIVTALPDAVSAVEADWMQGHTEWQHDRSAGHAVSAGLAALLADLAAPVEVLRTRVSEIARPTLAPGFTRAHPNQGYALLGGSHALVMALRPDIEPQPILADVVQQGYDTDTVAAICGSILGARFGCGWIPVERLADRDRLLAYADALVERGGLPEDLAGFMRREAALTAEEAAFQAQARV